MALVVRCSSDLHLEDVVALLHDGYRGAREDCEVFSDEDATVKPINM